MVLVLKTKSEKFGIIKILLSVEDKEHWEETEKKNIKEKLTTNHFSDYYYVNLWEMQKCHESYLVSISQIYLKIPFLRS